MTYLQMLEEGCGRLLEASIEEARQDATLLLLEVSGFSRADLFLEGQEQMPAEKEEDFRRLLARTEYSLLICLCAIQSAVLPH